MSTRQDLIVKRLTEEGATALAFFNELDEADWERRIYSEGSRWTVRQILCHFVSAEEGFLRLGRDILSGGAGAPKGMDIDEFNEGQVGAMADRPPTCYPSLSACGPRPCSWCAGWRRPILTVRVAIPFSGAPHWKNCSSSSIVTTCSICAMCAGN